MMLSMFSSAESFSIFATTSMSFGIFVAQLGDVRRAAHEAEREVLELLLDGERRRRRSPSR